MGPPRLRPETYYVTRDVLRLRTWNDTLFFVTGTSFRNLLVSYSTEINSLKSPYVRVTGET